MAETTDQIVKMERWKMERVVPAIFLNVHGERFVDSYAHVILAAFYLGSWGLLVWGGLLICFNRGRVRRWKRIRGWALLCCGAALGVLATASGILRCFPWDWRLCLQKHESESNQHGIHSTVFDHKIMGLIPLTPLGIEFGILLSDGGNNARTKILRT